MSDSQGDGMGARAAAHVDLNFQERQRHLILEHRRQEQRTLAHHKAQLQSFPRNRVDAELRHGQAIRRIDEQQNREAAALGKQQRGIRGRLTGMTKAGRARQADERDKLDEKFDQQRFREHRNLEAVKERQFQAEQAGRISRAREMKLFRQDHLEARQKQAQDHQQNRPRQIEDRTQAMRRVAEQEQRQALQQQDRQREGRTR